jgi:phosphate transport system substrate-binding protein
MKKQLKYLFVFTIAITAVVFSCKKKDTNLLGNDTILEGKASVLVDETLMPIVEDQLAVFENTYNAKITLVPQSEKESVIALANEKVDIIILSRKLNSEEEKVFKSKNIVPRTTSFATDAVAFVKSKTSNDTLIALNDVIDFIKGKQNGIKGLVFDNPNSSTVRYLSELAKVNSLPENGIFSFKTNDEVLKYVSNNDGMIGVVGINWIAQPKLEMQKYVDKINVLSVKGAGNEYVYPSQDNITMKKYPLARDLYIINCQGYEGLGIGFASFIAGEIGQRIILKSGLAPIRIPGRKIVTRNQIENDSK